jgi:alpha-beta hydrolase superfamily lysophospholipase
MTRLLTALLALLLLAGCSRTASPERTWVDDEVTFEADGLTLHGTYHHMSGDTKGPAALLISESGVTDRNGDNNVAGPIGNMRQLAQFLAERGVATLRYDKVGTGKTGLGPHAERPADVGTAVFTAGATSALGFLAGQPGTDPARISVYALGEGTIHAMALAGDTAPGAPKVHSLGLLQPLNARYLDLITGRVTADMASAVDSGAKTRQQADEVMAAWQAAVAQVRSSGTVAAKLPEGLSAIVNPGNVKAVKESDAVDPLDLAARIPAGTPVLLTCSDSDAQSPCSSITPLADALAHTRLELVRLRGVSHVLRDDASDSIANYAKQDPLSAQLTEALGVFAAK